MKKIVCVIGLAWASACGLRAAETGFTMYNIVPFSPGKEKVLAADCREYVARTGNRTVLYSLTLHPEGRRLREIGRQCAVLRHGCV